MGEAKKNIYELREIFLAKHNRENNLDRIQKMDQQSCLFCFVALVSYEMLEENNLTIGACFRCYAITVSFSPQMEKHLGTLASIF